MLLITRSRAESVRVGPATLTLRRIYPTFRLTYESSGQATKTYEFTHEEHRRGVTFEVDGVSVMVGDIVQAGRVALGFTAPADVLILREELASRTSTLS